MDNKRRNGDRWWYKTAKIMIFTFTPMAVGMTVWLFSNFASIDYVDAENEEQSKLWQERQMSIDSKLDFLVENVGNSNKQIEINRRRLEEEIRRDRDRRE